MKIVADTGPLIGLAKIRKLALLRSVADEVLIPTMVHRELLGKPGAEAEEIDRALQTLLRVAKSGTMTSTVEKATARLDEGERQAVVLAAQNREVVLLMDDRAGRNVARQLAIPTVGLAGLLLLLKEKGQVEYVTPLLHELRQKGYWLSDKVIATAARQAGEL